MRRRIAHIIASYSSVLFRLRLGIRNVNDDSTIEFEDLENMAGETELSPPEIFAANLIEWCLERHLSYRSPTWKTTGERESPREQHEYVRRGGSYMQSELSSRSCKRTSEVATARVSATGVRPARLIDADAAAGGGR